jgi:hypothetical protein
MAKTTKETLNEDGSINRDADKNLGLLRKLEKDF